MEPSGTKILFLAELRGKLSSVNELARKHGAQAVVHTSAFGFYDQDSACRINIRTMRKNVAAYSPLVNPDEIPAEDDQLREYMADKMSELPKYLSGELKFDIPVYTVWGSVDDLRVVEKFRSGDYQVPNLHVLDEKSSYLVDGLRICGLGGAFRLNSLFDAGDAELTIPGSALSLWMGAWQLGELANTLKGHKEPKLFVTHAAISQNPLLEWFSIAIRAKYTLSANLHLAHTSVVNHNALEGTNLAGYEVLQNTVSSEWESVWSIALGAIAEAGEVVKSLCQAANSLFELTKKKQVLRTPYRNVWHFGLSDVGAGTFIAEILPGGGANLATTVISNGKEQRRKKPAQVQKPPAVYAILVKTSLDQGQVIEKLAEEDRELVTKIAAENGAYIIHFASTEIAQNAYSRVDKSDMQSCYVYNPNHHQQHPRTFRGRRRGKR